MKNEQAQQQEQEQEPFLSADELEKPASTLSAHHISSTAKAYPANFLVHAILIVVYTICSFVIIQVYRRPYTPPSSFNDLAFTFSDSVFHNLSQSPYAGPPSPELDAAWDRLLVPMHMRVSADELRKDDQESVKLTEGGGYLSWMGVFHELHCINMLRKWNYRIYYHSGLSSDEERHLGSHIDHCFEMLRQSAVCHADASMTTFKWHPRKSRPMFNASESVHTCVDWDTLMQSAAGRVVDEDEILRLQNPLMSNNKT